MGLQLTMRMTLCQTQGGFPEDRGGLLCLDSSQEGQETFGASFRPLRALSSQENLTPNANTL